MPDVSAAPLYIDDAPHLTLSEIRSKCRRLKTRTDLRLVVVDYVQLLPYGLRQFASRYEEINEISRHLKIMAKELELPVIAVSKLNRGPEQRSDKRPLLNDLRDSGTLEDDADMVILLHREDAYEKESPRAGEADLIVAKHRHGPTATVTVAFQGHYSRFVDMANPGEFWWWRGLVGPDIAANVTPIAYEADSEMLTLVARSQAWLDQFKKLEDTLVDRINREPRQGRPLVKTVKITAARKATSQGVPESQKSGAHEPDPVE